MVKLIEDRCGSLEYLTFFLRGDFMNKCLCPGALFPLFAVLVAPIAFYILTVYLAIEQRIACSVMQAVNIPYGSVSNISVLLFFVGALVIAISRMLYATVFCLRTTYATWQEHKSRGTNDVKE
jgi:hypothetical protein